MSSRKALLLIFAWRYLESASKNLFDPRMAEGSEIKAKKKIKLDAMAGNK
jgi:hypothetical protein